MFYKFLSLCERNAGTKTIGGQKQSELVEKRGFSDYFLYTKECNNYDPAAFGEWQVGYSEMMDFALGLKGKKVLDIGCAAGAMVYGFSLRGADAYGCDINETAITSSPFPIRKKLSVVETSKINRHYVGEKFDIFHSQQVFEHFPGKEYSEEVVRSIYEITANDSLGYVALIAGDHLTEDDLRDNPDIDPTHINIWPMEYWRSLFEETGFVDVTEWFSPVIMCYQIAGGNFSFYKEYDWQQLFLAKGTIDAKTTGTGRLIQLLDFQKGYADRKIYEDVINDLRVNDESRAIILKYI